VTVFLFFGHPGAGKTTLCRRFGALHGIAALDTDRFMLPEEIAAVQQGRYTQAMRLANIERYCAHVRGDPACRPHVALADGLPNNAARRFALAQFPPGEAVLVLVQTERALWERRLAARAGNVVEIGVREADAYVAEHWEEPAPDLAVESIENTQDTGEVDAQLADLWLRRVRGE